MKKQRTIALIIPLVLIAVLLLTAGCTTAPTAAQPEGTERTLSVTGEGEAQGTPDVAVVTLGVQTEAEEASEALSSNSTQMSDVIGTLREAGVAEENIQTQQVRLRPQYESPPGEGKPELTGYVATNTVEVRVRDLDILGDLLDTTVEAGGNRVEGIRFEISDPTALLDQAREAAWNDAQQRAEQLTNLSGVTLGEVMTINESGSAPGPVVSGAEFEEAAATVPVQPGSQSVVVTVHVTWTLE